MKAAGSCAIAVVAVAGITISGTPGVGMSPVATSASAATWQTPATGADTSIQVNGTVTTTATPVNLKTGLGNVGVVVTTPTLGNVEFNLSKPFTGRACDRSKAMPGHFILADSHAPHRSKNGGCRSSGVQSSWRMERPPFPHR